MTAKNIYEPETHALTDSRIYTYGNSNHAVTSITSSSYGGERFNMQYDAAGNMILQRDYQESLAKEMTFDSNNRITMVTNPDAGDELIGR